MKLFKKHPKLTSLRRLFGRTYVLNLRSDEIHNMENEKYGCHLESIVHYKYLTKRQAFKLVVNKQANGCCHCCSEWDNG